MTAQEQSPGTVARPDGATVDTDPARKAFVEPAISSPVDVLEATTFFQAVDSGGTGVRRNGE